MAAVFVLCATVGAGADAVYTNVYQYFDSYYETFTEADWNGRTKLAENTVYYVDKEVKLTITRTLPESSLLVIRDGGKLTVEKGAALYIRGCLGVGERGILEVDGKLVLNSTGVTGVNGSIYAAEGCEVKVYGDAYIYRDGLFSVSGSVKVLNRGVLYYANDFRLYNNGAITGSTQRISGMELDRLQFKAEYQTDAMMRFYDRENRITYKVTHQNFIKKVCEAVSKIRLLPVRESIAVEGDYENRYAIRLYDSAGEEYFYIERPESESGGFVYINGIMYTYAEGSMTFDDLYYYIHGVRTNLKR